MIFFSCDNYNKAYNIYKSSNPERHKIALEILKNIPHKSNQILSLYQEIQSDYVKSKKEYLKKRYKNTLIAYINKDYEICTAALDGENNKVIVGISSNIYYCKSLRWSRDGQYLAFSGKLNNSPWLQIFVVKYDGSELIQMTNTTNGEDNDFPDWSNDNKKIIFNRGILDFGHAYIVSIDFITKKEEKIFSKDPSVNAAYYPIWLNSSGDIIFVYDFSLSILVHGSLKPTPILESDDNAQRSLKELFAGYYEFENLALSNKGDWLAFHNRGLKILNFNNKGIIDLDSGSNPSWAPDDKYIIYYEANNYDINGTLKDVGIYIKSIDINEFPDNILIFLMPGREPAWSPITRKK